MELTALTDDELVAAWRQLEIDRNQLAAREHALIAEVEARALAASPTFRCDSTATFARLLLRITPREATARVEASRRFTTHVGLSGESLEPIYPATAAALAAGEISPAHATVIARTVESLPHEIAATKDRQVEAALLEHANAFDPASLAVLGRRILAHLDPDGTLREHDRAARDRSLDLHRYADGTGRIEGRLTAEAAELLQTTLDALSKPTPAPDGTRDSRTPTQRRHDAFVQALRLNLASDRLPTTAGCVVTVVLHMDADTFATGQGTATTGYGYTIPAELALAWLDPRARVIAVLLDKTKTR